MDAKEYLSQIKLMETRIHNREDEIKKLLEYSLKQTKPTDTEYIQHNGSGSRIENQTVSIADLESVNSNEIIELTVKRDEIISIIESLNDPIYERILYLRYCQYKTWDEIGDDIGKSYQWVNELHKKALKKVEKIIKKLDRNLYYKCDIVQGEKK